ncbi:IclR family transcriptional regulator [Sphingobacterium sp. HJSM2_6]|uniref:IclR family transcriptional regulator n=1 Tax=Sphingobacterium sp. HJSM2_6 TaxID=3366264 RepID=UPI003BD65477
MEKKKNGIQSIDVGFSILTVLVHSATPLPLKTISAQSGLSPSKIHSYLTSFITLGMVEQNVNTGFYSLGPTCLKLGLGYLDQVNILTSSQPIMLELAQEIGQTVFLGVWGNRGPTIVNRVDGPYSQTIFDLRIGSVLPLLSSALGKNFAAHLPLSFIEPFIVEEIEKQGTLNGKPIALSEVYDMLDQIKLKGISTSRGQLLSDYTSLSVPILDFSNMIYAGITIMGKIDLFDDRIDAKPAKLLKEAGRKLSELGGWTAEKYKISNY